MEIQPPTLKIFVYDRFEVNPTHTPVSIPRVPARVLTLEEALMTLVNEGYLASCAIRGPSSSYTVVAMSAPA